MSSSGSGSESDSSSRIDSTPAPTSASAKKTSKKAAGAAAKGKGKEKAKSRDTISSDEDESDSDEDDEMDGNRDGGEVRIARDNKYSPPSDMKLLKVSYASTPFDYDTFAANPKLELWAVRIPDNVKTKHLSSLSLSLPSASSSGEPSGSLKIKSNDYTIKTSKASEAAEELGSLKPMLPRKSKGGYLMAPRPISRHLVLAPTPLPSSAPSTSTSSNPFSTSSTTTTSSSTTSRYIPPIKPPRLQPLSKLKFRNIPFGYGSPPDPSLQADQEAAFAKEKLDIAAAGEVQGGMEHAIDGDKSKGEKKEKKKGTKRKSMAEGGGGEGGGGEEKKKKKSKKSA